MIIRAACKLVAFTIVFLPAIALADSATWDGNGATLTDGLWSDVANWGGVTTVPGTFGGETATFDNAGGGFTTIDLGAGVSIANIFFDTSSAAPFFIGTSGSQTLNIQDGGTITMNSPVVANETISGLVTLGTGT
ncbi:MAG TPA: hypothetical protein VMJ32_09840, partial [Pirellulales bacterium]|nr:hypothetical protein [Pirellulales bacterium]